MDHKELIERLENFDTWALSLSSPSLRHILPLCPEGVRVGMLDLRPGDEFFDLFEGTGAVNDAEDGVTAAYRT